MKLLLILLLAILLIGCGENNKEDPLKKDQWYLDGSKNEYIDINLQHSLYRGRNVLIAIVDNGIDIF
ncbi:MAG: hypothetical protein LGB00_06885, partial [Sulfurovum sp.]|nr:hypothetical protein [Sulfurovum sp.]